MSTFGERIRIARENKGLLQSELAASVGVKSSAVISNWEQNINKPDAEKMIKLCQILGVSPAWLLDYYGAEDINAIEHDLLFGFRELNDEGQRIALDTVHGLIASGRYQKASSPAVGDSEDRQVI